MAKRAQTSHSFVVGINKPAGLTSHDVVNRVRHIYGERRVGHTGTLDPAATGVLVVCVGPATRLDRFLVGHDKSYEFDVVFGSSTTTDDDQGDVVEAKDIPKALYDESFALRTVEQLVGHHRQLPPAYSAVRVDGKKAYEVARAGKAIDFNPRDVQVYSVQMLGMDSTINAQGIQVPVWHLACSVSSGTYVRSLARDLGVALGTVAHARTIHRTYSGRVALDECISLEVLEQAPFNYIIDPVDLLGYRIVFARDGLEIDVANGKAFSADGVQVFEVQQSDTDWALASCTAALQDSPSSLRDGELVSVVIDNRLKAIYAYDERTRMLRSTCGFSIGVQRGAII